MGCVSSKLFKNDPREEVIITCGSGQCLNHVASLTSNTYGFLNLDKDPVFVSNNSISKQFSPKKEDMKVTSAWELMEGLEEAVPVKKSSPNYDEVAKPNSLLNVFHDTTVLENYDEGRYDLFEIEKMKS